MQNFSQISWICINGYFDLQHKHKLYKHLNCNRILSIARVPIFLENQSFLLCFVFLSKGKNLKLVSGIVKILPILAIIGNNSMYKMLSGKIPYHLCIKIYLLSHKQTQFIRQFKTSIKKPLRGQKKKNKADQLTICLNLNLKVSELLTTTTSGSILWIFARKNPSSVLSVAAISILAF